MLRLAAVRSLAPASRLAPRLFGTSSAWRSAEALQDDGNAPAPDPETVGWGTTRVEALLKAKAEDSGAWLWCAADDFVIDAVRKMTHANVGSLLVFDPSKMHLVRDKDSKHITNASKDAVVGLITERDYLTKVVVKGKQSSSTKVSEIMTPAHKLQTVTPKHSVLDVMELMVEKNFRHVPVMDSGSMQGMVSIRDVVHTMLKEHRQEVDRLNEYIQGSY
ncbi:hypothetical protein CHLNCDRAFT_33710 [Chlorella variabilis]|uniref:CBS domain-containing protein n=1 Tax=Chlorella variabilis TaxID=554065 RepID=E1Z3K9_CHLVA|nr:hypothetical protein CHLNCDRAFT_33710 [Chlorella variabilis]EFN60181.1 hypothetical protein CHLNCDRAFT_33710 [Chlorella variabilis]|eukprot:XP_005852283.1 hypothetical protein CHLNCDRAFT_33710 [Chlorella variabilis]